uniref:Uncharacterized protein n=1 Tax=Chenopodium quinoa TaxID=63459 RepID=A0A803LN94_CHEQI
MEKTDAEVETEQENVAEDVQQQNEEFRRSTRESIMPHKFRDYVYTLPSRKGDCNMADKIGFTARELSDSSSYSKEYVGSLNNVFKVKEPHSYKEASKEMEWVMKRAILQN